MSTSEQQQALMPGPQASPPAVMPTQKLDFDGAGEEVCGPSNKVHRNPKILIISSDTGGGHRSAAAAIVAGVHKFFEGESYAVRVVRAVEDSHHLTAKLVRLYNWILTNRQHWMKYFYWCMNHVRPETREFFHKRCIGFCTEIFERWCPHVVVSVHPLTQHIFGRILRELKLSDRVPLV